MAASAARRLLPAKESGRSGKQAEGTHALSLQSTRRRLLLEPVPEELCVHSLDGAGASGYLAQNDQINTIVGLLLAQRERSIPVYEDRVRDIRIPSDWL
jgi:hypothetical protein